MDSRWTQVGGILPSGLSDLTDTTGFPSIKAHINDPAFCHKSHKASPVRRVHCDWHQKGGVYLVQRMVVWGVGLLVTQAVVGVDAVSCPLVGRVA